MSSKRDWWVVLAAAVGSAVVAAVIWVGVWTPPSGFAWQGKFLLDSAGLKHDVDGTGLYVLCAAGGGVVLGIVGALVASDERRTLAAIVAGASLAALVMVQVGQVLVPADAARLAKSAADGTTLDGDLTVIGLAPLLIWPIAALASYLLLLLWISPRGARKVVPASAVEGDSVAADARNDG